MLWLAEAPTRMPSFCVSTNSPRPWRHSTSVSRLLRKSRAKAIHTSLDFEDMTETGRLRHLDVAKSHNRFNHPRIPSDLETKLQNLGDRPCWAAEDWGEPHHPHFSAAEQHPSGGERGGIASAFPTSPIELSGYSRTEKLSMRRGFVGTQQIRTIKRG